MSRSSSRGFQFTQKLEGMFNDMRLSVEGANTFGAYLNKHGVSTVLSNRYHHTAKYLVVTHASEIPLTSQSLPLDLQVSVLTTSNWPPGIIASSPLTLPAPLADATTTFQDYYYKRHSGRRLTWQGNLGTADVRVRFKARSHDLNLSTQALVVLLAFEEVRGEEVLGYQVSFRSGAFWISPYSSRLM